MKALLLAAGNGTRLKPLTNNKPKALVEINGVTLLERNIKKLMFYGVNEIIINVHHHASQIIQFLKEKDHFGIKIEISDERDELLDTGGGLLKASWFFDDKMPFFIHNVDVLSEVNLEEMLDHHNYTNLEITLAVKKRESSRYLLFDKQNHLIGWKNAETKGIVMTRNSPLVYEEYGFSGIQVMNPSVFNDIKEKGKFSLIDLYLTLGKHYMIGAYIHNDDRWVDVGTKEKLKKAKKIADELI